MEIVYRVVLGVSVVVAVLFAALVFITGKGDAMAGGGSIRTSFKGKASFDDLMSKLTLILGISFMALMIIIDVMSTRLNLGH